MIMATISRVVSAWFAFLLPCYNTYKALSHRPVSEPELERLAMFWCVVGGITAVEMTTEWLYSWFPFYYEIKTFLLLFLSLPQTQGSTWVYQSYVQPYLRKNEVHIDKAIADAQSQTVTFMSSRFAVVWDMVLGMLNKGGARQSQQPSQQQQQQQQPPGRPQQPVSPAAPGQPPSSAPGVPPQVGPWLQAAQGMWSVYGPAVMGAVSRGAQNPTAAAAAPTPSPQRPSAQSVPSSQQRPVSQSSSSGQQRSTPSQAAYLSTPTSPPIGRGSSSGYQARPPSFDPRQDLRQDPRQVPLPPSGAPTPAAQNLKTPPIFPEPKYYR